MDKIKKHLLATPLKKAIRLLFAVTFLGICIFSVGTVLWMNRLQSDILDRKEFTVNAAGEYVMEPFTDSEAVRYYSCEAAMFGLPILYLILGMVVSSGFFYRLKLQEPIEELGHAISMTAENDLDFSISYSSEDELGSLCRSMERMRQELCRSNEKEWVLLQQRRLMNASVAHDLRTPLTVLKGYLGYLKQDVGGKAVSDREICTVLDGMGEAVERLEQYVDCIRDIDSFENLKVQKKTENMDAMLQKIERAVCSLGGEKEVEISGRLLPKEIETDKQLLIRIAENLTQNAVRYAKSRVAVELCVEGHFLVLSVQDDGKGFLPEELSRATDLFYTTENEIHFGIGLSICKMICENLDGTLSIGNGENGGACVTARIKSD